MKTVQYSRLITGIGVFDGTSDLWLSLLLWCDKITRWQKKQNYPLLLHPEKAFNFCPCKLSECYFFTKTVQYRRLITEIGVFDGTSDLWMIVAFTSVRQNYQLAKTKLSLIFTPRKNIAFLGVWINTVRCERKKSALKFTDRPNICVCMYVCMMHVCGICVGHRTIEGICFCHLIWQLALNV